MRRALGAVVLLVAMSACGSAGTDVSLEASGETAKPPGHAAVGSEFGAQDGSFPGIFPFTSQQELDAYAAGTDQTFRDPVRTAREFAVRYLGFTTPQLADGGFQAGEPGAGEVPIGLGRDGQFFLATTVVVRQLAQQGPTGPWTVTAAASPRIEVDSPGPLQRISSPVTVSGRADAFEGTVNIDVREDGMLAGQFLGSGFVTAAQGRLEPFRGQVTFRSPSRPGGAVVFQDRSGAGVEETAASTVVRVLFTRVSLTG